MTTKRQPKPYLKWIMASQSTVILGSGLVFPFYLIFIREMGSDFTQFGIAYGLFTLCSAYLNKVFGNISDRLGRSIFLIISAWGTAFLFLLFPLVTSIWQIYVLQILLGAFNSMQKTCEKALLADFTDGPDRGAKIGNYHFWISIFSGFAVIAGGFLIDLFTLDIIFYMGSVLLFVGGLLIWRLKEKESSLAP